MKFCQKTALYFKKNVFMDFATAKEEATNETRLPCKQTHTRTRTRTRTHTQPHTQPHTLTQFR